MNKNTETFESLMLAFGGRFGLESVFDDFITVTILGLSHRPLRHPVEHNAIERLMAKYQADRQYLNFLLLLELLQQEIEDSQYSIEGSDVLGMFYGKHLAKKDDPRFSKSWAECFLSANMISAGVGMICPDGSRAFVDVSCGSGRMLLALAAVHGQDHRYCGIADTVTNAKLAALSLYLNGIVDAEVMWVDPNLPEQFGSSYRLSGPPKGIRHIERKEQSWLWMLYVSGFPFGKRGR
jgi:hypothetical protein